MPKAVSNSSTLTHLSALGRLDLLQTWYEEVVIPPAVWKEVVEQGRGRAGSQEIKRAAVTGWIRIVAPTDELLIRLLKRELGEGEAEAIVLALQERSDILLVDESDARRVAEVYGLRKTGIVGILIRAKREGRIMSLAQELGRLRTEVGFWISDALYRQALEVVGEA